MVAPIAKSPAQRLTAARQLFTDVARGVNEIIVNGDRSDLVLSDIALLMGALSEELDVEAAIAPDGSSLIDGTFAQSMFQAVEVSVEEGQLLEREAEARLKAEQRPDLSGKVLELEQLNAEAERAKTAAETGLEEVRLAETGMRETIDTLSAQVDRKDQQILNQSGTLGDLRTTLQTTREGYDGLLRQARERTARVNQQLETARAALDASGTAVIDELREQMVEETEKLNKAMQESAQHQEDLARADQELQTTLDRLSTEHARYVEADGELQAAKAALSQALDVDKPQLEGAIERQQQALKAAQSSIEELEGELVDVRSKRDQTISELREETKKAIDKAVIFDAIAGLLELDDSARVVPALKQKLDDLARMTKRYAEIEKRAKGTQDEVLKLKQQLIQAKKQPAKRPAPGSPVQQRTAPRPPGAVAGGTRIGQPPPAATGQGAGTPAQQPISQPPARAQRTVQPVAPTAQQQGGQQQGSQDPPPAIPGDSESGDPTGQPAPGGPGKA